MARWFVDRLPQRGLPSVSLRRLLPEAQFAGCADWKVFGCTDDHRRLEPGQVFVAAREARPGYDGHLFVREALERGAAGVVVERPCPEAGRLQVIVPNATAAHARICQALAGDPSHQLVTVGVTGSFGKTITALMVRSIIDAAGDRCGLVGSLGFCDGSTTRALGAGFHPATVSNGMGAGESSSTTASQAVAIMSPELSCRARPVWRPCWPRWSSAAVKGGVLEVAGEALAHHSFEGVAFHAAVVTDVAAPLGFPPEVLLQKRRAKAKLVRQVVPGGVAVVNADDPNAEILGGINLDARRVAFALEPAGRRPAEALTLERRLERIDGSGTQHVAPRFQPRAGPAPALGRYAGGDLRTGRGGLGMGDGDRWGRRRRRPGVRPEHRRTPRGSWRGPRFRRSNRRRSNTRRHRRGPGRATGRRRRSCSPRLERRGMRQPDRPPPACRNRRESAPIA